MFRPLVSLLNKKFQNSVFDFSVEYFHYILSTLEFLLCGVALQDVVIFCYFPLSLKTLFFYYVDSAYLQIYIAFIFTVDYHFQVQ